MPKTITVDNGVASQVRLTTDATGAIHVYCDYTLYAATTPIQALTGEATQLLGSGDQISALALFNSVLQAIANSQSVTAIGPSQLGTPQSGAVPTTRSR